MKQTLLYIVSAIVDNEKEVSVAETQEDDVITFILTVAKEDMGKVIGKEGKIIRSLRNVMKIPAIKQGKRIQISLAEQNDLG